MSSKIKDNDGSIVYYPRTSADSATVDSTSFTPLGGHLHSKTLESKCANQRKRENVYDSIKTSVALWIEISDYIVRWIDDL